MFGSMLNLVNGEFRSAGSGQVLDVVNPATDEVVGHVPSMDASDLAAVFDAAERGAHAWRAAGHIARGQVLHRAAALIRERADELATVIVAEMGKTRAEASGEVGKAAEFFEYYAGLSRLPFGQLLPDARPSTVAQVIREPLGVVVLITPWNDPLLTPARKLAPALMSGNAVVIKPASETPLVMLKLAEILHEAGLPAGALGTVTGRGAKIGDALIQDPQIRAVSFTGSTAVGLKVQRDLAGTGIRVQTEMGGKNAAVVLDDADLDLAILAIMGGAYGQGGQRCTATSRLIVQRGIASEVKRRLSEAVGTLRVAAGDADGVDVGPVVSRSAQAEIREHVSTALAEGAEVLARASLSAEQERVGAFVEPLLVSTTSGSALWKNEVFGPVVGIIEIDTLDEAITAVNDSTYGLACTVFTDGLGAATRFVDEVDTGQVSVNQPTTGWDIHMPFGGFKESGSAFKEQGLEALQFYTRVKTVAMRTR
ncbi:MAG: aldehyde dehydrogenase family protein [Leucobacter sp.]